MPRKAVKEFHLPEVDRQAILLGQQSFPLWCEYFAGWQPQDYQTHFVCHPAPDKLWLAGIRGGKSSTAAVGHLYTAFYKSGARTLNTSISLDQARVVFVECLARLKNTRLERYVEDVVRQPYPQIKLVNDSEVWFRPIGFEAELLRGWEFDLISIDEVGYVVREITVHTLRGRLLGARRLGWLWQIGTPKGKGWVYKRWLRGDPSSAEYARANPDPQRPRFLSMLTTTRQNKMLPSERVQDLEESYSSRLRQQEMEAVMLDDAESVFPLEDILKCQSQELERQVLAYLDTLSREPDPEDGLSDFMLPSTPGHQYVVSVDLGKGKKKRPGRGATVAVALDISTTPWQVVGFRYVMGAGYKVAVPLVQEWKRYYRDAEVALDSTGPGDPIDERLEEEEGTQIELPIRHTGATKAQMLHWLQMCLERGLVEYPFIKLLVGELRDYQYDDKDLSQDCVMALAQAVWLGRLIKEPSRSYDKRVIGAVVDTAKVRRVRVSHARTERPRARRSAW